MRPTDAAVVDKLIDDFLAAHEVAVVESNDIPIHVEVVDQEWAAKGSDIQAGWKGRN